MVAAEELGLPLDRVRVEVGSTRYGVYAPVSGGSQTMPSVAPAVRAAAYDLRGKLLELAGDVFEVSPDDLRIVDGEFVSLDGALREPIAEVTGKLGQAQLVGTGSRGPNPDGMRVHTFGCQIAQVAVDAATGEIAVERIVAVHDIGRVISPLQARSQVEGGVLQGLGFALMEERVVDPTTGTVVNANLEDYKLPTHADCPEIVVEFIDKPDPHASTLGLKGLGRAADRADRARDRERRLPRDRRARARRRRSPATASSRRAPDERLRPPRHARRGARAARRARRAAARRRHRPRAAAGARQGAPARSSTCARLLGDAIERKGDGLADRRRDARRRRRRRRAGRRALRRARRRRPGSRPRPSCAIRARSRATSPSTCAAGTSATPT